MCWVAFDRAVKSCTRLGLEGPTDHWRSIADTIHADICENGFDQRRNSFVQHYGGDELDAALLLMPQVGFLPASDPRVIGTVKAIEAELLVEVRPALFDEQVDDGVGGRRRRLPGLLVLARRCLLHARAL